MSSFSIANSKLFYILAILFSLGNSTFYGPPMQVEICDNALDDDGNGLIDLNDPACDCQPPEPFSQIPNPSFEDTNCCPSSNSQLSCADTWIQASEATTDYYHRCGYFEREGFPVPKPIPDGDAYIGFRNGSFARDINPNWKEYTGACLLAPLLAGTEYTFQFHIGFVSSDISPPMRVVFYGTTDCKNLPFGVGDREYGCPLNGPGWKVLGQVYVSGRNSWVQYQITTTPDEDITAIAIGPDCIELDSTTNPYYFLDNLILADAQLFGPTIEGIGHPCSPDYILRSSEKKNATYQWYRDGIALPGEQSRELRVNLKEGNYQVRTTRDTICLLSDFYSYRAPQISAEATINICAGETYTLGRSQLTESGTYIDTLQNKNGCDSIVLLNLRVIDDVRDTVEAYFFKGEDYRIGPYRLTAPTQREVRLTSPLGCDSLVSLTLKEYPVYIPNAFSPNGDNINDSFSVFGDETLVSVESLTIFDRWGNQVFQQTGGEQFEWNGTNAAGEVKPGIYLYMVELQLHDGNRKVLSGDIVVFK